MNEFKEGTVNFPPTYKFDKGTLRYDSSKKPKVPAWPDRILFRDKSLNSLKQLEYDAKFNILLSDHLPVYSFFEISTKEMHKQFDDQQIQKEYFSRKRFDSVRMNARDA